MKSELPILACQVMEPVYDSIATIQEFVDEAIEIGPGKSLVRLLEEN